MVSILGCMNHLSTHTFAAIRLSALRSKEAVDITIADELRKGFIIGPFDQPSFDKYRVSPIGAVDKEYSIKKRLISRYFGTSLYKAGHPSISELIDKDEFSLLRQNR